MRAHASSVSIPPSVHAENIPRRKSSRRVCDDLGIEIRPPRFDPLALLEIGAGETRVGPDKLLPIYPREPDAVTQWRSRKGSDSPDQPSSNCC
jgi:hypothetical protein